MVDAYRRPAVLALAAAIMFFTNLGGTRLWDRDEPRNAGCAAEMLARGDWVTPVFNGELRSHKPVLTYWFMMSAYAIGGVSEFTARFWSAVGGIGTVLLTYYIGRRMFGPQAAMWSGVALMSMAMFQVASRAATPDASLVFFSTAAIAVFVASAFPRNLAPCSLAGGHWAPGDSAGDSAATSSAANSSAAEFPRSNLAVVGMYALMGVGILAKGPVGLVLPTAVIGMYLLARGLPQPSVNPQSPWPQRIWQRGAWFLAAFAPARFLRTCWSMRPLTALAAALVVAAPWYLWVGLRTDGQWPRMFLWEHNLGRALTPMEGHRGSILYYPTALIISAFPWSLLAPPMLRLASWAKSGQERRGLILAGCWVGVHLFLFSLASTKLPSYITPALPGFALMIGWFCEQCVRRRVPVRHRWSLVSFSLLGVVGVATMIGLPIAARMHLPGLEWLGSMGAIPLTGAILAGWFAWRERPREMLYSLAGTACALLLAVFTIAGPAVDRQRGIDPLMQALDARGPRATMATYMCLEPSWIFYSRRKMYSTYLPEPAQPAASKAQPRPQSGEGRRQDSLAGVPAYPQWHNALDYLASSPDALLLTRSDQLPGLRDRAGFKLEILMEGPLFLRRGRTLVLLRAVPASVEQPARRYAQAVPRHSPQLY